MNASSDSKDRFKMGWEVLSLEEAIIGREQKKDLMLQNAGYL